MVSSWQQVMVLTSSRAERQLLPAAVCRPGAVVRMRMQTTISEVSHQPTLAP